MAPEAGPQLRSGIVVFARSDSRRLPGKVLRPLEGRPMLAWTVVRLLRSKVASVVVVATSDRSCDDAIAALANQMAVPVVRGSCDDVLGRAKTAMREHALDLLVRISGDSPFIDSAIVDEMLAHQSKTGADLVTNVYPERRLMPGLSVEVMTKCGLAWVDENAHEDGDREHVTSRLYSRARTGDCPLRIEAAGPTFDTTDEMNLAVDTETDFSSAAAIAKVLGPGLEQASWQEIVRTLLTQMTPSHSKSAGPSMSGVAQ